MRIVLDTNVLVSGFLSPHGPPGAILRSILAASITLCLDERILTEYRDVLTRGRFAFVLLPRAFVDEHRPSISNFIKQRRLLWPGLCLTVYALNLFGAAADFCS